MVCVDDLQALEIFQNITLVSDKSGLNRRISWPNIAQTPDIREWIVGGDVIIMSGVGLQITDEFMSDILMQAYEGGAACLIILTGSPYIKKLPSSMIRLANKIHFPVFAAPWETKLSYLIRDISQLITDDLHKENIQNEFWGKLTSNQIDTSNGYERQLAKEYGLHSAHQIAVCHFENSDKKKSLAYKIANEILAVISGNRKNRAFVLHDDEVLFVLHEGEKEFRPKLEKMTETFMQKNPLLNIRIGIGEEAKDFRCTYQSYQQAEKCLRVREDLRVMNYSDMGICQLFLEIQNQELIQKFVEQNLGALVRYDREKNQDLVKTLTVFLEEKCNIYKTSQRLFIHRNTMVKRLHKIEQLLQVSFNDAGILHCLYDGLLLLKYFKNPE